VIRLEVLAGEEALAERAAVRIREAAEDAVRERGSFAWAISGGATPLPTFRRLDLAWPRTTTFQVDERVAPGGHPDRNLTWAVASLPAGAVPTLRPMPVEGAEESLETGAAAYAATLPTRLDLAQLGLGQDGHTASLVPGDAVLEVHDRDVAVTGPYEGRRRMTLTYPAIDRARHVLWIVSGEVKADALRRLLERDGSIPAARVSAEDQLVLADAAATGWHEGQT
jgi:6-phosphogluconolactonase/glucosamine-6-phosphate isomerase/deaminase